MDDLELKAVLKREIEGASGYIGDEVSADRARLLDRYLGRPIGNEIEGRSKVVSSDVSDVIETVMPDLMQIFTAGTQAVKFDPQGPEDEHAASQANDLINHIFYVRNNGFLLLYDLFKDALIQINGFAKVWVDKSEEYKRETFTGLTEDEMVEILNDPGVEPIEHTEREDQYGGQEGNAPLPAAGSDPGMGVPAAPPKLHDLTVKRKESRTRFKVEALPPEEVLFSRNARTLEDSSIVAHRRERMVSDLIEEGYDPEVLSRIPTWGGNDLSTERISRDWRGDDFTGQDEGDEATREILIHEVYLKVDYDGDGIAELRQICAAGPNYEILENEEADEIPIVSLTPIRMPHRVLGMAVAELAEDIQLLKTSLWRSTLDNFYFTNNGRLAVSKQVKLEDVLSNRIGAPIRVETANGDVGGHVFPVSPQPIGAISLPLLEYADTVREVRTGITRYSQGLDAESLNKTATGINQILGRSQQRVLLIARLFAESGVKDLFRKLLKLTIKHSDKAHVIRLRNKWVEIDPRSWNAEMDMTINVGLGHGTQDQRAMMTQMILQIQEKILQYQGGIGGPIVTMEEIGNTLEQLCSALGFKSSQPFFREVDANTPMPPPKPDPEMEKAKAELQIKQMIAQEDHQLAEKKMMLDHTLELQKMGMENAHEKARLDMEMVQMFAEMNLDRRRAAMDAATKRETAMMRANQTERKLQ